MNMAEAKTKLMEISKGEYHTITYELSDHGNGDVSQDCKVYVNGHGRCEASKWEYCLQEMEDKINGVADLISEDLPFSEKKLKEAA